MPNHRINPTKYSSIAKFIPTGYTVLDQADGDLNDDGLPDKVLVLKRIKEEASEEKRPVLLLIRQKERSYKLAARNDNVLLSFSDGGIHGDPYHGVTIKNGCFSLEHFGGSSWRWNLVITFNYDPSNHNWYLYKTGSENWHFDRKTNFKSEIETKKDFGTVPFASYKNKWRDKD